MSDPGLEPGDARLVELTLAVHDILLSQFILSPSNPDRLCGLPAQRVILKPENRLLCKISHFDNKVCTVDLFFEQITDPKDGSTQS